MFWEIDILKAGLKNLLWDIFFVLFCNICASCMQVLELLKEEGDDSFDTIMLLQTLGQVKTDVVDGRLPGKDRKISSTNNGDTEMKGVFYFFIFFICWSLIYI